MSLRSAGSSRSRSTPGTPLQVAVALGSNLGDRHANLEFAVEQLRLLLDDLKVSGFVETAPFGVGPQPAFLNGAAIGTSRAAPRKLLDALLAIEREAGRERPFPGAARTLDLDLILVGDTVLDQPGLQLPHPRFRERRFVLEPLAEVAPAMTDPVTGRTIRDLLAQCKP